MLRKNIVGFLVLPFLFVFCSLSFAEDSIDASTPKSGDLYLIKGELETVPVSSLTRLSITNPEVADIVNATDKEILLIAKTPGQTVLFVWDEGGKRPIMIHVFMQNLELVKERVNNLLKAVDISEVTLEINENEGKLVMKGEIPQEKKAKFDQVISPFSDSIINLSDEEGEVKDLVQIDLQITELNTTLFKTLGFDWTAGSGGGFSFNYPETLPTTDGSYGDFFKIGEFNRTTSLLATVNALVREGKGKVLSQPKLVVVNGQQASFLVGGQVPIRTTTSSSSGTQENVSFKDYGISMEITPKITKDKIDIDLSTEISDIDSANFGEEIGFVTRNAQTKLYLNDGQTIVLAGLIKSNRGTSVRRIPFLSKIPIAGMLFRSRSMPSADTDTELVISLTPYIITDRNNEDRLAKKKKKMEEEDGQIRTSMPVPIPKPSSFSRDMAEYMKNVQQKLVEAIRYPQEAQGYGWEGTVKLNLLILEDGTLALAHVVDSSGYDVFDQDAVETAQRIAPYAHFPPNTDLHELELTIPIVYSLNKR